VLERTMSGVLHRFGLASLIPLVDLALAEDLHAGDPTTFATVAPGEQARAWIIAKQDLRFCGGPVAEYVFGRVDPELAVDTRFDEGAHVEAGTLVMGLVGNARSILLAERTALNFLQRACGVATTTVRWAEAAGPRLRVLDTRKTQPGLRALDRHAVRCGGGYNHRNDLGAGILIKENHVRAAGSVTSAVYAAKRAAPHLLRVECEVTTMDELRAALAAGADVVLLDNMDDDMVREALDIVGGRIPVEVSGGVSLERLPRLAAMGVDFVSVGALTHSVRAADLSLLFDPKGDV
jgi:nicotinate-nucleotide pyrophosphorylase (carboxylating)